MAIMSQRILFGVFTSGLNIDHERAYGQERSKIELGLGHQDIKLNEYLQID